MSESFRHRLHVLAQSVILLGALLVSAGGCAHSERKFAAELILHNARIWTADENNPSASAVAIRDGKFVAVGNDEDVLEHQGLLTRVIDLEGRFALPGFNDSHIHFASAARFIEFNIMTTGTQEEFTARVKDVVSRLGRGEWILGGYWGAYDQWTLGSEGGDARTAFRPDMRRVDFLTKHHPMFIQKFDRSEYAVNTAAIEAVGLDPRNPSARGVEFERDAGGRLTGIVRGESVGKLFGVVAPRAFSHKRRLAQTKHALREIARHGVTSVSDMSDDEQLEIYRELHNKDELTVRVHFRYGLERWQELADKGIRVGSGDEWIRLGSLKGHIDGIMGTSSARFLEPYAHDSTNRGRWRRLMVDDSGDFVEGKFLSYMLGADKAGLQITVHAIGDEANQLLLNYIEELNRRNGRRDRRFRLVHAQVVASADIPRLGELGVIGEVQPYHLSDDMRWMEERIGRERCKGAYAFKDIRDSGATLSFGSDWPGTSASSYPINPMLALYAVVTRQTIAGAPPEGWFPAQRISIAEALKAYTSNNAYASFEEEIKGSIEVGKLADIVVLSKNLLEIKPREILDTQAMLTIVGGRIVYRK